MTAQKGLKLVSGLVGIYHITLGFLGMFFKSWSVDLANIFFGFKLDLTDQMHWVINPMAAYFFVFGLMLVVAAKDPVRNRPVLFAGWGIFVVRIIQRCLFILTAQEQFFVSADPSRAYAFLAFVFLICITMLVLLLKVKE